MKRKACERGQRIQQLCIFIYIYISRDEMTKNCWTADTYNYIDSNIHIYVHVHIYSWRPGVQEVTKSRGVCVRKQAFAVRKRSRVSRIVSQSVAKCRAFLAVENSRETQNCRHFWTRVSSSLARQCQQSQGSGRSWSRNAELIVTDLRLVVASRTCQQSQGSGRFSHLNVGTRSQVSVLLRILFCFTSLFSWGRGFMNSAVLPLQSSPSFLKQVVGCQQLLHPNGSRGHRKAVGF